MTATNSKPEASDGATGAMGSDDVRVDIKEWRTPTAGAHPHDPLVTSDGAIWYTGQMANPLGRLDPKTGQFGNYRLKTPDSGPHGLVADANGAIWFTASYKGYIGKLDPTTGDVREFKLPDPAARDPHTPVFDQKGILWFTVIGGNMLGRLDPVTGDIKLMPSPTTHSLQEHLIDATTILPLGADFTVTVS